MKILKIAENYTKKMDIWDLGLLKFCLFSGGIMLGTSIPKRQTKPVFKASFFIFLITYCVLMTKFIATLVRDKEEY